MKYGAVFPQTEIGSDPIAIRDFTQAVEEMGLDYIVAYDHVLGANPDRPGGWNGPYTHKTMFHEVFTLFAYMAAITERVEFATGILILPQRQTALVAKQAAEVDVLSGGRFRLGIGVGWNHVEYDSLGQDFTKRGKRVEEQIDLLNLLWTQDLVTFEGDFHQIDDAGINPLPVQRPIPIWFGGYADVVLKRMARKGAGWLPGRMSREQTEEMVNKLHDYLRDAGRDPSEFGMDVRLSAGQQKPDEWDDYMAMWEEFGATHFALITMDAGYKTLDDHINALKLFAEQVGAS